MVFWVYHINTLARLFIASSFPCWFCFSFLISPFFLSCAMGPYRPIITFFCPKSYIYLSPSFNSISTVVLVSIYKQLQGYIYIHVGGSPLISLVELILIESSHTIFLCYCCCFLVFIQTCDDPDFASIMHIHKPSLWRTRNCWNIFLTSTFLH